MIKTAEVFRIIKITDDNGFYYFYADGEQKGERFIPAGALVTQGRSSIITPSQKPEDIRREKEAKKVERISSLDNIVKSHAKKEDQVPTGRLPEGRDS